MSTDAHTHTNRNTHESMCVHLPARSLASQPACLLSLYRGSWCSIFKTYSSQKMSSAAAAEFLCTWISFIARLKQLYHTTRSSHWRNRGQMCVPVCLLLPVAPPTQRQSRFSVVFKVRTASVAVAVNFGCSACVAVGVNAVKSAHVADRIAWLRSFLFLFLFFVFFFTS